MGKILGNPRFRAFKDDNSPGAGYKLLSYVAGTTTPQATYASQDQSAENPNPTIMDGSGEAEIWLGKELSYKLVLTDDSDVVIWTLDNVQMSEDEDFAALTADSAVIDGTMTANAIAITSTAKVANLNADKVDGGDWDAPGALGAVTPAAATVTTLTANSDVTKKANDIQQSANGAQWVHGQISEEITLSLAAATTDSGADLLPANSIIEAVVARVTGAISTAANWSLGDATTAARFLAATTDLILGTTKVGIAQWNPAGAAPANGPQQSAAAKLRVTCNATATGGKIRVTVFYRQFVAPTS
jgi:hypothetical protein